MSKALSPETLVYDVTMAGDPWVSPDGSQIVYTLTTTDRDSRTVARQLWACGIDGTSPRQLTWNGARNGGGRWSSDGQQIAFVSDRVQKSGIFVLPIDAAGEAREITRHGQAIGELAWSPDGLRLAYIVLVDPENPDEVVRPVDAAPRVRVTRRLDYKQDNRGYLNDARSQVFVVDVATGARRQITTDAFDHSFPQWSPDGRRLAVKVSSHNGFHAHLVVISPESGETQLVGAESDMLGLWAWSPSGDRIMFATDVSHNAQFDFFIYDVAGGTARRLTDDLQPLPDAGFPTLQPPAQPVWLDDRRVLFHGFRGGASELAMIDSTSGAVEPLRRWEALHSGLSVDAARRYVVQAHSRIDAVGEIVVYDTATARTQVVTNYNGPLLQDHPAATWEKLTVQRGGFAIDAWLLKPPGFDASKRYPLVLDVHGGPHGYYGYGFNAIQQCLATNDFLVLYVNPRGSASYGRTFAQQVVRDWGGEDYLDLMAVVDTVLQRPYIDPARTGIYGYSYGGYMTSWTIGRTNRFKAAVCGAPCFDLESMYGTSDIGHVFCNLDFGGAPHEQRDWYAAHSPSTLAHQARTPTLIIHGEADDRCPIGQGEQMFVALMQAGCEVEFARYPGGSHLFLRVGPPEHRADVLARILGWFKAHLGDPA